MTAAHLAKTFVFFPEGAFGPTNNCVGIGDVLSRRGHRVVFVVEESFKGTLAAKGFEERLMRLGPAPQGGASGSGSAGPDASRGDFPPQIAPEVPGQFWKDFIRDTAPVFRQPTLDQLEGFIAPTWQALADGARYVDSRLAEIFDELGPDVIVEDNVVGFPAISASGRPWVRIASCNPLELKDPKLPPTFSGYAIDDRSGWSEFRNEYARRVGQMQAEFSEFCVEHGAPPLPALEFIGESPWLNLYLYPAELDYPRSRPLAPTWHNLETSVRTTDPAWEAPSREGAALIYVSLGSLGSADVALMERLVDVLSRTPHRYVVSKGPQHQAYELAENMTGGEFLPQTSILPEVDLVITHGGNNTTTEAMYFGKAMIVLPIFWDQHDNAQRVHETSHGVRLPTYSFEDRDLVRAIDRMLGDESLLRRLKAASERLQARPGTQRAADLIEQVAAKPAQVAAP
jgi:UDP:flavonoid glycosyltransferase YjiC (YdhE family)